MSNVNSKSTRRTRGFSLIEAIAAVTILGVGVAAVMGALGAIAKTESRLRQSEAMTRLAEHKFDELTATSTTLSSASSQNGDFTDQNNNDYLWTADVADTGVTNLEALTVKVTLKNDSSSSAPVGTVSGILYEPPPTTTSTGAGQ